MSSRSSSRPICRSGSTTADALADECRGQFDHAALDTLQIVAARRQDKLTDRVIVNFGLATSSVPEFVSAAVLMTVFCVHWKIGKVYATPPDGTSVLGQFQYLLMPALAMAIAYFGYLARMTRAGVISAQHSDYARTATMKGLSKGQVMRRHILRNALAHAGKGQRQMVLAAINTATGKSYNFGTFGT